MAAVARADLIELSPGWEAITHTPVLAALFGLFLVDFLADKVPALDHALHAVGLVVQPAIGAGLFDLAGAGEISPLVAMVAGGGTAGSIHAARAAVRPAVSGLSGGLGAPLLSLAEDVASLLLVVTALLVPIIAALAVIGLLVGAGLAVWAAFRLRRRMQSRASAPPAG